MHNQISKDFLEKKLEYFCEVSGQRVAKNSKDVGGLQFYFNYGGVQLLRISNVHGGCIAPYSHGVYKKSQMLDILDALTNIVYDTKHNAHYYNNIEMVVK